MTPRAALRIVVALGIDVLALRFLLDLDGATASALDEPGRQATDLTLAVVRLVGLALGCWLALVLLALLVTSLPGVPASLRQRVDRRTRRGAAGIVRWAVGASTLAFGVLPGPAAHATTGPPVLAPMEDTTPAPVPPRITPVTEEPEEPVDEPPPPAPAPAPPVADEPVHEPIDPEPADDAVSAVDHSGVDSVIVAPGDSFWSVSERLLARRLGRPVSDAEVIEPWLALIEANRDRLADPADPDLLRPGQSLTVPRALR